MLNELLAVFVAFFFFFFFLSRTVLIGEFSLVTGATEYLRGDSLLCLLIGDLNY